MKQAATDGASEQLPGNWEILGSPCEVLRAGHSDTLGKGGKRVKSGLKAAKGQMLGSCGVRPGGRVVPSVMRIGRCWGVGRVHLLRGLEGAGSDQPGWKVERQLHLLDQLRG